MSPPSTTHVLTVPQEDSPQAHSSARLARPDAAFHRLSQLFALLVLGMLTAIVVSLAIGAIAVIQEIRRRRKRAPAPSKKRLRMPYSK